MKRAFLVAILPLLFVSQVFAAELKLGTPFTSHMVLQREKPVAVWGWADAGETVSVKFADQTKSVEAGEDGKWMVQLDSMSANAKPQSMTIEAGDSGKTALDDILVGEVWLGSGQSNMVWTVQNSNNAKEEIAAANYPNIRLFKESSGYADTPQSVGKGQWAHCSPQTVGGFSATLYYFGREIHKELDVPVGLIVSAVGGTPIESWIDGDAQLANEHLAEYSTNRSKSYEAMKSPAAVARYEKALENWKQQVQAAKAENKPTPRRPRDPRESAKKGILGGLYNAKISPLIPYTIRGALWYQGESNASPQSAKFYQHQLPLLVTDWRQQWGEDFPFAWVQLPNYDTGGRNWPVIREGMMRTLKVPNTGMAITLDIGDPKDIHPKNKQDVGYRLSLWAMGTVYGKQVPATSGPLVEGFKTQGNSMVVKFMFTAGGLKAKNGSLTGFEIAGEDQQWKPAEAKIDGSKVVVSSPEVKKPAAVRYAWENNPKASLFNDAGLPASPFRTQEWGD